MKPAFEPVFFRPAFSPISHSSLARKLAHAACAGNVSYRCANQAAVARIIVKAGFEIQGNVFFGLNSATASHSVNFLVMSLLPHL
jgi:hypothetical protein